MIFVIDDDEIMAECVARSCKREAVKIFSNAYEAIDELDKTLPEIIFLDILLDGPDGFTFLNEIVSYNDTSKIPIVIISSLDFSNEDLSNYGVVGILNKNDMTPKEILEYVIKYTV